VGQLTEDRIEERKMETGGGRPNLGTTFYKCRAAREANLTETVFDLTTGMKTMETFARVGVIDRLDDDMVKKTFHGPRVNKYHNGTSIEVNQGITVSYDPSTLMCMACDSEHKIAEVKKEGQPVTLAFTDQNFVSALHGNEESCIGICRIENCSLMELADLVVEVFDGTNLKPGTVVLLGSVSHLHRVGVSLYARDWVTCITRLEKKWGGNSGVSGYPPTVWREYLRTSSGNN
jgi:hypothetical protein